MFALRICAVLLVVGYRNHFSGAQMCFAPRKANPMDSNQNGTAASNSIYLYTALFNYLNTSCTGELVRFDVCYQFNQNTEQQPAIVFKLLILEDNGMKYSVVAAIEEREDRDCIISNSQCCKSLTPSHTVTVEANYSLAIIIPATHGGNLFALSTESLGYLTGLPQNLATAQGSLIFKSELWLAGAEAPAPIADRSVRIVINPHPNATVSPTTASISPSVTPSLGGNRFGNLAVAILAGTTGGFAVLCFGIVAITTVIGVAKRRKSAYIRQQKELSRSIKNCHDNKLYVGSAPSNIGKRGSKVLSIPEATDDSLDTNAIDRSYEKQEKAHEYEAPDVFLEMKEEYEVLHSAPSIHSQLGSSTMSGTTRGRIDSCGVLFRRDSLSLYRHESVLDTENIFEDPATDEKSLYAQYKRINIHHISQDDIILQDHLGSGQFGTVQRGVLQSPNEGAVQVAVKTLKEGADKVKFLQEAAIMGQFTHPSIVKLHGVVILREPKMIVLELLEKGDLSKSLLTLRPSGGREVEQGLSHTLLSYCRQVASGMSYLAGKAFVHRDLAARNILISEDGDIKIADFGMSRDILEEHCYISQGGKIPVRWTAPEAIHYKKYSAASDVWSFGVVMYEIWSLGHKPFETYTNSEAISMVDSGVRLPPPPGCPRAIYTLMIKCWHSAALERPDFPRIVQHLSLPDTKLLKWSAEDKGTHPEVASLGAELNVAVDLYKGLQNTYLTTKP